MPTFDNTITGFAAGDDLEVKRTINRSESNIPSGVLISKAWFTVKLSPSNDDSDDTNALFQKEITTVEVGGQGEIENDGTGDTDPVVRFDLTPANTRAIGTTHYRYDIQVLTDGSKVYTGETGDIFGNSDVTVTTS